MGHYIDPSLITDSVIKRFLDNGDNLEDYFDEADFEMLSLARRKGVQTASQISVNETTGYVETHELQRYLVYYVCMRVAEDKIGANSTDVQPDDVYQVKYDHYSRKVAEYDGKITADTIVGQQFDREDMVSTAYGLRG